MPAREVAETIIFPQRAGLRDGRPARRQHWDLEQLRQDLGLTRLRLATEAELGQLFPACELGAMPPFGNLFNLPVFLDFERLAHPAILPFARRDGVVNAAQIWWMR